MKSAKELRAEADQARRKDEKSQFWQGVGMGLIAACVYGVSYNLYSILVDDPFLKAGMAAFVAVGWFVNSRSKR